MAEYKRLHKESIEKPHVFWAREAKELHWDKKWSKVLDWKAPYAKWFVEEKPTSASTVLTVMLPKAVAIKPPSSGKVSLVTNVP